MSVGEVKFELEAATRGLLSIRFQAASNAQIQLFLRNDTSREVAQQMLRLLSENIQGVSLLTSHSAPSTE